LLTYGIETQIELFFDTSAGGFFSTAAGQADLILRLKDGMDNAEPSTNGFSASNLNRLSSILDDQEYEKLARKTVQAFEAETMQHPFLFASLLESVVAGRLGVKGIVVTGDGEQVADAMKKIRQTVGTNRTLVRLEDGLKSDWLKGRNSLLKAMDPARNGVQVCEAGVCKEVLEAVDVERALGR
jgi:uncharacterized protein YyaL (SSP411 family)